MTKGRARARDGGPLSNRRSTACRASSFLILLAIAALWSRTGAASTSTLHEIQRRGVLRWGADIQGGEPYVFRDPQDTSRLVGFEVEIAESLARRLGVRQELVQNDWQHLVASLQRGDFDIILNGLEATPARQDQIALSWPYYGFEETLVVRREETSIHALADLAGKRVGTLNGSLAYDILAATAGIETVLYEGVEEPYIDLEQGRLDGVVLDHIIAERYGLVRPTLRRAATVGSGVYVIGVRRRDGDLLDAINAGLDAMIRDGELGAILTRWKLWDARQVQLLTSRPTAVAAAAPSAATAAPRAGTFTASQLQLFLRGAGFTVVISTLAMALAVGGGLGLSVTRHYGSPLARGVATAYVELFRGTPVLLQLYVLYYGLAPWLTLSAFSAAVIGLGLNYAAYEAEIYRAGLQAVPAAQTEAALALGMPRWTTMRRIILPQAIRIALPGVANDFIALLKDSSLVSVITVVELTKQMTITAVDVRGWLVPGLVCAAMYLALSYPLSLLARRLERHLSPELR